MNHWHNEFMAEYHRQDLIEQMEQIRLADRTVKSRLHRPGLFEATMFRLANWMIATGRRLRKRYEIPAVNCNNTTSSSFAH
ncbi:MAG: hypothetical protein C3F07_13380 [Anaerolineales bacterium]|nr:hypothetical protein [Anaerolineae bacterium]PWB71747.1 MAG: hypothetical protein C3F07_13380 [Anaerolineales bacterium]